jgi:hypothetical protein
LQEHVSQSNLNLNHHVVPKYILLYFVSGADSLQYLSVDGLVKATQEGITKDNNKSVGHCVACLTGSYPIKLDW